MNILFLTLSSFKSINERGIYIDLIRKFSENNHNVFAVCPYKGKDSDSSFVIDSGGVRILELKTDNTQKEKNKFVKGFSVLETGKAYKKGIKKYFSNVKFDLVLCATPPITFYSAVKYVKKRDNAIIYLMLKDIFPQNAVDLEMMSKSGIKGIIYRYFREIEKKLYKISDKIGCMSPANIDYILSHNEISPQKVEVMPNSIFVEDNSLSEQNKKLVRLNYNIPVEKTVFVYGGNLGKPQGIPFVIECLKKEMKNKDAFFVIVGDGTEFPRLKSFISKYQPSNVLLLNSLPKNEYNKLVSACDVGLIFLDKRFTIPNFPSRLLGYLQAKLPVIAATDNASDIGDVIVKGDFGFKCRSDSPDEFSDNINKCLNNSELKRLGENGYDFLRKNYSVKNSYDIIMESVNEISVH